ncbi:hypothetical protein BJV82DRAFT_713788 [Fennellomyces sp. T-0311]|nr:hypothetical protein BJV82DRAFT_713788 [Fennellomyces sp. T-0311]
MSFRGEGADTRSNVRNHGDSFSWFGESALNCAIGLDKVENMLICPEYRDFAAATEDALLVYWQHCKVQAAEWKVIGYARKSTATDPEAARASLLQLMIKLKYCGLADKVFVNPCADTGSEIHTKDYSNSPILKMLKHCGTTNGLIRHLHCQ